jgi:conjugal transfer/entry exclusion protein
VLTTVGMRKPSNLRRARLALVVLAALAAIILAACGSSKPAYCTSRTNLENSIKGLTSLNASSGVSGLKSQLQKIQSDATTLVNQAKNDFPSETSAISSSVSNLESAVKSLSSSPSASQIASVTTAASGVVSSVTSFTNATKSKCS